MYGGTLNMRLHADAVKQADPNYQRAVAENQAAVAKAVEEERNRERKVEKPCTTTTTSPPG